ncbi:MAG TPA: CbiX/SirB N-terminal domain-containing protein [Polyangia bacterium]
MSKTNVSTAIVIVGHGSREPGANEAFEALVRNYAARTSTSTSVVHHAYIELATPHLDTVLDQVARHHDRIVVVPLFLFLVGHTKTDVPLALARARTAHPQTSFVAARELGVHRLLIDTAFDRARVALASAPRDAVAVVVGRGSSDPDANAEFCRATRLFGEGRGFRAVFPTFIGITAPLFPDTLDLVARLRPARVVVVPYMLFDGRLCERVREQAAAFVTQQPWIPVDVAAPLAPDDRLFAILDERIASAVSGHAPLPCDACQYRAPIAGIANAVGGMRALLYSIRHGFTHSQAAPHPHAHAPLRKHVLVCGNADCADRGSLPLLDHLRQLLRDAGRSKEIRVTRTSCMGRCGEGPTVAVYPDGIWYRGVHSNDAPALVNEHLLADRLVPHLIDNIMQ